MTSDNNREQFVELLQASFADETFIKATLSKAAPAYRWKRVTISAFINTRGAYEVSFEYDDGRQVERKNVPRDAAFETALPLILDCFESTFLRTTSDELAFERTDKGSFRLKRKPVNGSTAPLPKHNREKNYLVSSSAAFLSKLGITTTAGVVRRERYDKFRQIQKFIEIIVSMIPDDVVSGKTGITAVDFGSGKHYLTFALHHFLSSRSSAHSVVGVEQRLDLVTAGREAAQQLGYSNLDFIAGTIDTTPITEATLVVALHACDTATDDALAKAITAGARYILVAPCCHKYVRQRFSPPSDLAPMLRHGIVAERFADSLTDSLRVLVLESLGYQTKLFEFISPEHTAKNTMITAVKTGGRSPASIALMRQLCEKFSLNDFYLDARLRELL